MCASSEAQSSLRAGGARGEGRGMGRGRERGNVLLLSERGGALIVCGMTAHKMATRVARHQAQLL